MNTNTTQDKWADTKAKIKAKWSKFSDSELDSFKDSLDKIPAQVQKTYGIGQEQAERECKEFKDSIQPITPTTSGAV